MIDLNLLTLYKKKINSYIDENVLDISTKSNILNMFKIKNYTGNGIEPHGSVKIDENGIATLFTNLTDYIKTNLKALDVMNSTEFQVKFKTAHKLNRLVSSLTPIDLGSVIRVDCVATSALGNGLVYDCNPSSSDATITYFFKTQFDITKYYNQWLYLKVTNDNNNRTLTLSTDENILVSLTSNVQGNITENQQVILGQTQLNTAYNTPNLQIDLSETYFKKDDTIISKWNV